MNVQGAESAGDEGSRGTREACSAVLEEDFHEANRPLSGHALQHDDKGRLRSVSGSRAQDPARLERRLGDAGAHGVRSGDRAAAQWPCRRSGRQGVSAVQR